MFFQNAEYVFSLPVALIGIKKGEQRFYSPAAGKKKAEEFFNEESGFETTLGQIDRGKSYENT